MNFLIFEENLDFKNFPRKKWFYNIELGSNFSVSDDVTQSYLSIHRWLRLSDLERKTSRWGSSLIGDSLISVGVILWLIDPSLLIVSGLNNDYKLDSAKSYFTLTLFAQIRTRSYKIFSTQIDTRQLNSCVLIG